MAMPTTAEPAWDEVLANLRAFMGRRVRNPADAEDLVQRVLLQLVKGLSSLRDTERLYAWVYRTARNAIIDHYRSSAVRREVTSGDANDIEEMAGRDTAEALVEEDGAAFREFTTCLTPMLEQLTPAYRDALTLTEIEGHNQADAARRAGVSVSGMKSRVQRGRRQLRAALEACCRVQLDRRGGILAVAPRADGGCDPCSDCG